jgi:L-cysteine S-thiosulfotransferase
MRKLLPILTTILMSVTTFAPLISVAEDDIDKALRGLMASELRSKGPATLERTMKRDEAQLACSIPSAKLDAAAAKKIEAAQLAAVKYPTDGKFLGNWEEGEKTAQNGRGMQSSDAIGAPNGGNCYACHQIRKDEIAYGTIGPSLYQYGKLRGNSEPVLRYTWAKIYNAQAFNACSNMPRFGHQQILTEQQLRDVMALLMDPASPVNK